MLRELPHSPVKKNLRTAQSPGKVMAAVFWDVYRDLLVDFTPLGSTINLDVYEETQKDFWRLFGKRDQGVYHRSSYV